MLRIVPVVKGLTPLLREAHAGAVFFRLYVQLCAHREGTSKEVVDLNAVPFAPRLAANAPVMVQRLIDEDKNFDDDGEGGLRWGGGGGGLEEDRIGRRHLFQQQPLQWGTHISLSSPSG